MPIYEFFCPSCNTIYSFRSKRIDTTTVPRCPGCGKEDMLQRRISRFSLVRSEGERSGSPSDDLDIDDARLERAFEDIASDLDRIDQDNPRAIANALRRLSKHTGMEFGESMERALQRLEAGEDPKSVEEEFGPDLEGEEDLFISAVRKTLNAAKKPKLDDRLYEM